MDKLRILLADDHAVLRDALKALINSQADMQVVGEAANGWLAWQKAKELQPDVIVMDISMPEMDGVIATERLKQAWPSIKILVVTAHEEKCYLRHLLDAGASGFLLKRAAKEELTRAIRVVATNQAYVDPMLAGKVLGSLVRNPIRPNGNSQAVLSEREAEVLRLVAWGYSNKEIAMQLDISVKTVETYKSRLSAKLQLSTRAEIVRYAVRHGWLQES